MLGRRIEPSCVPEKRRLLVDIEFCGESVLQLLIPIVEYTRGVRVSSSALHHNIGLSLSHLYTPDLKAYKMEQSGTSGQS